MSSSFLNPLNPPLYNLPSLTWSDRAAGPLKIAAGPAVAIIKKAGPFSSRRRSAGPVMFSRCRRSGAAGFFVDGPALLTISGLLSVLQVYLNIYYVSLDKVSAY